MITQFLTRLFTSRPIKMLILLAVLVLIASQAVPQMVDANPYVERISAEVKTMTGAAMLVKGGAMLQILPHPALLLRNVEITQPDVARSPTLGADIAEFGIHLPSLFSGVVTVDKLTITKASLIAERQENGQPDWGYLGAPFLKSLSSTKPTHPLQISILSGQASIADVKTGKTTGITDMQLSGTLGSESSLSGMFQYNKQPITFSATRSGAIGATPIALQLTVDNGPSLSLNGSMDFTAEYPLITGKLAVASTDISHYIAAAAAADKTPVPLKLSGDYLQQQGSIQLSNLTLDTLGSQATGQLGWSGVDNSYTVGLNFSALDLTNVRQLLTAYVSGITACRKL